MIEVTLDGFVYTYAYGSIQVIGYVGDSEDLILPDSITYNGTTYNTYKIYAYAFAWKTFKQIIIPEAVTYIGEDAFYYGTCERLIFPRTLTTSDTHYKLNAFYGFSILEYVEAPADVISYLDHDQKVSITGAVITGGTKITGNAFGSGTDADSALPCLTYVVVAKSVTIFENYAFAGATSLNAIYYEAGYGETKVTVYGYGNQAVARATSYYYSENEPDDTAHNYWHYVDGEITIWN